MPNPPTPDSILEDFENMGGVLRISDRRYLLARLGTLRAQGMEDGQEAGYHQGLSDGRTEEKARAKKAAEDD
ncbi:MAG: hypothetical protein V3V32_04610 [Dehalococcoidia bacterium]